MKYLSLFSGIEACTVAWKPLGWQCVGVAEIEPFPCAVLAHHYPDTTNLGSVTDITDEQIAALGPIDLVVGGSPCQDLSVAGKREGIAGQRSGLFIEQMRIFHATRRLCGARWLLWENVPGAFSVNQGRDFAVVVGEMAGADYPVPRNGWQSAGIALGDNGLVEWRVLDAQWFGVAQRRRRVFAVLDAGNWASRPPLFSEQQSLPRDSAPRREAGEVSPAIPSRSTGGGGFGTDFDCDGGLQVTHTLRGEGFDASEDGMGRGTPIVSVMSSGQANAEITDNVSPTLNCNRDGAPIDFHPTQNPISGEVCHALGANATAAVAFSCKDHGADAGPISPTLRSMSHDGSHANGGGQVAVAFAENQRGEIALNDTAGALSSGGGKPGQGYPATMQGMSVRRLTPRECERLQGFPDDYTLIPYRNKPASQCPDGPRYKALGNSMAVPVMRWIGERIQDADALSLERAEDELVEIVTGIN